MANKNMYDSRHNSSKSSYKKPLLLAAVVVLVVVAFLLFEHFHNRATSGTIPVKHPTTSKTTAPSNNSQKIPVATPPAPTSGASGNSAPTSAKLVAPSGSFVSNHKPNLGGQPAPSTEESVCDTTAGASCYIQFTNGGVTKTLPAQTTNANGFTSWVWDIKQAGLTTGSWKITAYATLNGQTASTSDPLPLQVSP